MLDKSKFKDEKGRYLTQGLFLEERYNTNLAVFTLDGEDKVYKGKTYLSLKRLYLEACDPIEYNFAKTNLYDWKHWQKMTNNKFVREHVDQWRKELELYLVSEGVQTLVGLAMDDSSYQAAKYLASRGWDVSERGRPSNDQIKEEIKKRADDAAEYQEDFKLLSLTKGK